MILINGGNFSQFLKKIAFKSIQIKNGGGDRLGGTQDHLTCEPNKISQHQAPWTIVNAFWQAPQEINLII